MKFKNLGIVAISLAAFLSAGAMADEVDSSFVLKRIKERAKQQNNVSEADQTVLENQLDNIQTLSSEELKYCITIDTEQTKSLSRLWEFLNDHCYDFSHLIGCNARIDDILKSFCRLSLLRQKPIEQ